MIDHNVCLQAEKEEVTEISVLDILIIMAKYKKFIVECVLLFAVVGAIFLFFISKAEYVSRLQMAPITSSTVQTGDFNVQVPGGFLVGIVQSDSVLDYAIKRNGLLITDKGKVLTIIKARKRLLKNVKCEADRGSGIVTVSVTDEKPERARAIATSLYDGTLKVLNSSGFMLADEKDAYLSSEIKDSVKKLQQYVKQDKKQEQKQDAINSEINDMIKTVTMLSLYDEAGQYRNQVPMVVQLVSPASLPDDYEPRGRVVKMAVLIIVGFFIGLMGALLRYYWSLSAMTSDTQAKIALLKKLI